MDKKKGNIFVADAHLQALDGDTDAFISMLQKSIDEKVEVFLLGDIFDLWFGNKKLTYPFQGKVLENIRELTNSGLQISYIEGNRDFFIVNSWVRNFFKQIEDTKLSLTTGGKKLLLLHGDTVNKADMQYRFWRALSKNSIIYSIFSLIPGKIALSVAAGMEKRLKNTNQRFRYDFPENEGRSFAEKNFRKGFDMVIIGHFHREKIIRSVGDESSRLLICLPMWRETRRYFYLSEMGNFGFQDFNEAKPLIVSP